MLKSLTRLVVATVVLSSAAFAQRVETVQHTPQNGMTCTVKGEVLTNVFTTAQMEARIGGYSFGVSGQFLLPTQSDPMISYQGSNNTSIVHRVWPQFVWGAWASGLGTLTYRIDP